MNTIAKNAEKLHFLKRVEPINKKQRWAYLAGHKGEQYLRPIKGRRDQLIPVKKTLEGLGYTMDLYV